MRHYSALLFLLAFALSAQSLPEQSRFEITGFGWSTRVEGTLQSGRLPVDLQSDLSLADRWTFLGEFIWHPAPRHKLLAEGSPLRFEGFNTLSRTIDFHGRQFNVQEAVLSETRLDYLYAGYQFDILTRERGHLGVNFGGAFLNAEGTIAGINTGVSATRSQLFGLPLVGVEFRVFPIPAAPRFSVSGGAKGMSAGGYGYFAEGRIRAGYDVGPVTFLGGWGILDADIHETRSVAPAGVAPRITGPMVGVQVRFP